MSTTQTIYVKGDSKSAQGAYNDLSDAADNAATSTEKVSDSTEKAEGRIKVLGGAINLLGGSVEVLAGGLALTGAVTEEQAEKFQTAAVGAIAFADGSKRVLEGAKELREGFKLLGNTTKITTAITQGFGVAMKVAMGPVGIALLAIGALSAAIVFLKDKFEAVNKVAQFFGKIFQSVAEFIGLAASEEEKFAEASAKNAERLDYETKLLRAQGASIEEVTKKQRELLEAKRDSNLAGTEEFKKAQEELNIFEAQAETDRKAREAKAREDRLAKQKAANEKRLAEEKRVNDERLKAEQEYLKMVDDLRKQGEAAAAQAFVDAAALLDEALYLQSTTAKERELNDIEDKYFQALEFYKEDAEALATITAQRDAEVNAINQKYNKEDIENTRKKEEAKAALISGTIDNIQGALTQLFGESKAVAIANVLVDAGQAAVGIIKNSQTTGPLAIAYQVSQFALLAATTLSSIRQINSAEPGTGGTPSTPKPTGPSGPAMGGGAQPFGAPDLGAALAQGTQSQQGGGTAVRAYVISGDVTSAQEAESQIKRRRSL